MVQELTNDTILALANICFAAFVVLCITFVVIVTIVQCGKTKRANVLAENVSSSKKDELVGKQLESELKDQSEDKGNIIDLVKSFTTKNIKK